MTPVGTAKHSLCVQIANGACDFPVHRQRTESNHARPRSGWSQPSVHRLCTRSGQTPVRHAQEYRQCIVSGSVCAGRSRSELASTGLDCTSEKILGAAQDPLNTLIFRAFQHWEFPSPNLLAKNDVLDNGSYHELPMAGKAETPEWRRSLTITQGLLLKKSMSDADMLDDLRMSVMARKIAST